ncbi:MAG: hypothetical protein QMC93_01725 [Patescibacteria group bacterium]|nr:hypothetical protein [Patescibacteria group bacterium]
MPRRPELKFEETPEEKLREKKIEERDKELDLQKTLEISEKLTAAAIEKREDLEEVKKEAAKFLPKDTIEEILKGAKRAREKGFHQL